MRARQLLLPLSCGGRAYSLAYTERTIYVRSGDVRQDRQDQSNLVVRWMRKSPIEYKRLQFADPRVEFDLLGR